MARTEEHFAITYDGPAVAGGRMSVQELAPSLIALSRSVQEAQRVLEPMGRQPSLDIHAMREGSFVVDLALSEGILQGAIDFLAGKEATATVNLGSLVGYVLGAFTLTRWLRKKISGREDLGDGMVRITFGDGQTLIVAQESVILTSNRAFREAARDVVAPLRTEGVDVVRFDRDGHDPVLIETDDLLSFDLPPSPEEQLLDVTMETALQPVNVAFNEGNKWRVSDGDATYYATIRDQAFIDRVQAGEAFSKSDIIRARVRTVQFRDTDGELRTEREILEVLEHLRGSRDVPLPFDEGA